MRERSELNLCPALRPLVPQMLCPAVKLRFGKAAPQGRDPWPNSGMGRNRHRLQPMSSPYSAVAAVGPVPTIAQALMISNVGFFMVA